MLFLVLIAPLHSRIDFSSASNEDLRALADVCDAATFGMNDKNVLDETYRKAGKLDTAYFAAKFDPVNCGLLRTLREVLLEGHGTDKTISVELYKLNIYGKFSTLRQGLVSDMQLYRRRLFLQSTRRHSSQ